MKEKPENTSSVTQGFSHLIREAGTTVASGRMTTIVGITKRIIYQNRQALNLGKEQKTISL